MEYRCQGEGIGRRKRFNEGTRGECIMKKPRQEKGGTLEEPPWLDIRAEMNNEEE